MMLLSSCNAQSMPCMTSRQCAQRFCPLSPLLHLQVQQKVTYGCSAAQHCIANYWLFSPDLLQYRYDSTSSLSNTRLQWRPAPSVKKKCQVLLFFPTMEQTNS